MSVSASLGNEKGEQVTMTALPGSGMSLPPRGLDFTRAPFSKNGLVHVESCCNQCNFRMLKWIDDRQKHPRER
jgi:hypothetical protein